MYSSLAQMDAFLFIEIRNQIHFGYSYCGNIDTIFRELYRNGNHCMGMDINAKNWMVVTFFRAD